MNRAIFHDGFNLSCVTVFSPSRLCHVGRSRVHAEGLACAENGGGTRRKYCAEMSLKPQSFGLRPIVPAHTLVLHWISVDLSRAHACCPNKAELELNMFISLQYTNNKSWEIAFPTAHDRRSKLLYTSVQKSNKGATSGQFLCWQHLVWQANTVCLRIEALGCDLSFKQNPKHNETKMCAKLQSPILLQARAIVQKHKAICWQCCITKRSKKYCK